MENTSKERSRSPREVVVLPAHENKSMGKRVRRAETILRVVPMGLCFAALFIMIRNSQNNDYGAVSYNDLGAFKYLVYANGVCAAYSVVSAFLAAVPQTTNPPSRRRAWTLFFFDQVLTYMILGAGSASTEVLYLANKGDTEVTWARACDVFTGFCHKATTSVGITFGSLVCYIGLTLISSYRLFSAYDAPGCLPGEVAAFPG